MLLFFVTAISAFAAKPKKSDGSDPQKVTISADDQSNPNKEPDSSQELVIKLVLNDTSIDTPTLDQSTAAARAESWLAEKTLSICDLAKQFIGTPYRWGGTTPKAFDCSGFVKYVYAKLGVKLPRTAREQFKVGKKVKSGTWKPGDLVFFDMMKGYVSHVGMYLGNGMFIHASTPRTGVRIDYITAPIFRRHYVGARRYDT